MTIPTPPIGRIPRPPVRRFAEPVDPTSGPLTTTTTITGPRGRSAPGGMG